MTREIARVGKALGRRVAELREAATLTQQALADRIGVSPKYVQEIEAGRQNVTLTTIVRVAVALDVGARELFDPPTSLARRRPGRPGKKSSRVAGRDRATPKRS